MARQLLALPRHSDAGLFDSYTIRLNRVEMHADGVTFVVSHAQSVDYLVTNYSMDVRLENWRVALREMIHPPGYLDALDTSLLVNHIGLGALLLTCGTASACPQRGQHLAGRDRPTSLWSHTVYP